MVTFTTNKGFGLPAVGGDSGVWGPPINNNSSALDASLGGSVVIPISSISGALTLLASNYLNVFITFTGTVTQNTIVTFPAVGSFYTIQNQMGGSSQFTLTLATTAVGSQVIGCPPFQTQDIMTDGSNVKFRGLPHVGAYWDYAGSSVPNWVSACTVPPWLNCDGTAFSSATYPYLATIFGGTTLPDSRARVRMANDQGTGRVTSTGAGFSGGTNFAAGGIQSITLSSLHLPQLIDPGHGHSLSPSVFQNMAKGTITNDQVLTTDPIAGLGQVLISSALTGITYGSTSQISVNSMQPTYVGGITMVRAG